MISMELPIQNLLEENEEYLLVIQLEAETALIYYYTRIIESQNKHVSECIDFVRQFNDTTFGNEKRHLSALIWKKRPAITRLCSM